MDLKTLTNIDILGLTIIGEGRGEPIEGQTAIGSVIRNRYFDKTKHYKSYHDVCLEPYQFSCWNEKDPNKAYLHDLAKELAFGKDLHFDNYLKQCLYVAQGIKEMIIMDNTKGAKFYMETSLFINKRPGWATQAKNTKIYGHHTFFSL